MLNSHLDLESSLEAAGKEAAEGSDDGGKGGESDAVDLERIKTHRGLWRREETVTFTHIQIPAASLIPLF